MIEMSIAKAALAVILIGILAFALMSATLTTTADRTEDLYSLNDSSHNRTAQLSAGVSAAGLGLLSPLIVVSGILCLMGAMVVLSRWSKH